jgi:triacylglycerol lipase
MLETAPRARDDRAHVDPELHQMLDLFPTVMLTNELLPAMRRCPPWAPVNPADRERTDCTERAIPGPAGAPDVMIRIYRPRGSAVPLPCIFHMHGGGYVAGDAADLEGVHLPLAADLGCVIVSVNYRLAPETPLPGGIEDCYAALSWSSANASELGIDPARIGLMGESAGGGLAAALALLARDRGEIALAFQHLIYPMIVDRTCVRADPHPIVGGFIWTPHNNRFGWSALLGREPGGPDVSPYAAAARADDLSGLPPTFISTGGLDLLLEENIEYARRLSRAANAVELHVYPGAFHAFNA